MTAMLNLIRKWKASYQVLHHRNAFGFFASVRPLAGTKLNGVAVMSIARNLKPYLGRNRGHIRDSKH